MNFVQMFVFNLRNYPFDNFLRGSRGLEHAGHLVCVIDCGKVFFLGGGFLPYLGKDLDNRMKFSSVQLIVVKVAIWIGKSARNDW